MDYKSLFKKLLNGGKKNNFKTVVLLLAVGLILVIAASFFKTADTGGKVSAKQNNTTSSEVSKNSSQYEENIQSQLKGILEKIQGVNRVDVMVYFESGEEKVPATNANDSTSTSKEKDNSGGVRDTTQNNDSSNVVTTNDGSGSSQPLILKTYKPKITGVCVVADGAENEVTSLRIKQAVVNLFNISPDKVNVYPMKK